ncbi:hypothetical protein [Aquimarina megaterium]|uniref:hypothetical protein n=1 Tax=Aquimarina megaterium TaxID=1443666 RepID=UPI00046E9AF1|nr:hypothetical protein [Aquimarina megaterium]
MDNLELTNLKNRFIASILKYLKENIDQFHTNLTKGENYETTLYEWSISLFNEGKSIDEAVEEINKRRMLVMLSSTREVNIIKSLSTQRKLEKVMLNLEQESCYSKLKAPQKTIVNERIEALANTDLWNHPDILEFALTIIKKNFQSDDSISEEIESAKNKKNPDKKNGKFLSEFRNYLQPKTIINDRRFRSPQLN